VDFYSNGKDLIMKIIHETPILVHDGKYWSGQVAEFDVGVFHRTVTWRDTKNGQSKIMHSEWYAVEPKNVGRSNATTAEEQGILEMTSMMQKKIDKGYVKPGEKSAVLPLPMLAHKFKDKSHKIAFPLYVQPKYNGMRMLYDGEKAWSRGGKIMIPEVIQHIHFDTQGYIVDGELMLPDSPLLQETMKAAKKYRKGISDKLVYFIYDIVLPGVPFSERDALVKNVVSQAANFGRSVLWAPTVRVESEYDILREHKSFTVAGFEGTMIRTPDNLYEVNKRSHGLLKLKDFQDAEFRIVDVIDGGGKFTGQAIFVCETEKGVRFNCTPEGNVEYRRSLFDKGEELVGKWLTVRYFELTNDGVPQFPVGVAIREDGEF
jgi:DNA ligase-1